ELVRGAGGSAIAGESMAAVERRQRAGGIAPPAESAVLERSVGVDQPRADHTDARLERLGRKRLYRASGHLHVVVEEDENAARRRVGAGVVSARVVPVLRQRDDPRAVAPRAEE